MASSPNPRGGVRRLALLAGAMGMALVRPAGADESFYGARVAPILERHCVVCHGDGKHKAELRLDSIEGTLRGSDAGPVVKAGDVKDSELFRRITLPATDEEAMPSDGKPPLSPDEIKLIELWIQAGASAATPLSAVTGAPLPPPRPQPLVPAAPDWRPHAAEIAALQKELGVHLVPRSSLATDGLVLRTASAPGACDDVVLGKLGPLAVYIVEAELARTKVTDAGMTALARCENLRALDLTRTQVTSAGLSVLARLPKLEALNLTFTAVDAAGAAGLKTWPALKRVWLFGTKAEPAAPASAVVGN